MELSKKKKKIKRKLIRYFVNVFYELQGINLSLLFIAKILDAFIGFLLILIRSMIKSLEHIL